MRCTLSTGLIGAVMLLAAPAWAETSRGAAENTGLRAPSVEAQPDRWNRSRREQARPLPLPMVDPDTPGSSQPAPEETPEQDNRAAPDPGKSLNRGSYERASGDPNSIPLRWAGKLYYRQPDGDYSCSGQFITNNVVLTAAHCVQDEDNGRYYRDFRFELQYHRGRSVRRFDWECVATKAGWANAGDQRWRWDYAMLLVRSASPAGHFGWHYGWRDEYREAPKIGYPAGILNGEVIQIDRGPLFFPSELSGLVGLRHGNPKNTGGSSGGGWIGNFTHADRADANYVISVESHWRGDPSISYGPRFDAEFESLLDYTERGCRNP